MGYTKKKIDNRIAKAKKSIAFQKKQKTKAQKMLKLANEGIKTNQWIIKQLKVVRKAAK